MLQKVDNKLLDADQRTAHKHMKIINYISMTILVAGVLDMAIVLWTIVQIANGAPTPHIPYWDAQIKAILSLMQ